jgi:hypothetical protein
MVWSAISKGETGAGLCSTIRSRAGCAARLFPPVHID